MNELALGIVVFTFLAVPASLLLLVLADVIKLEGAGRRRRWIRACLAALALPAAVPFGYSAWGWAGAAHLEPLCQAYATPEFRGSRLVETRTVLLDASADSSAGKNLPAWTSAFGVAGVPRLIVNTSDATAEIITHVLEVRRVTHHRNLWFDVQMERFRVLDRRWGTVLAEGDELWVDAGRSRHHCGIVSGASPVASDETTWPAGDGVAKFVMQALRPAPLKP